MGCAASTTVTFHDVAPEANPGEHQEGVDAGAPEGVSGSVSPAVTHCSSPSGGNSSSGSIQRSCRKHRRNKTRRMSDGEQRRVLFWLLETELCNASLNESSTESTTYGANTVSSGSVRSTSTRVDNACDHQRSAPLSPGARTFSVEFCRTPVSKSFSGSLTRA